MKQKFYLCLIFLLITLPTFAQQVTVSGTITASSDGTPLAGVSVILKTAPGKGTLTDGDGKYTITATPADVLVFSFIGFASTEIPVGANRTIDVPLQESMHELGELIVTGSRGMGRTALETAVPVDIISIKDIMGDLPQIDLAQMLTMLAPSFNAVRSQGGDLDSHVDPIQLRNLAPNQTLVLVNGKRRHTSAQLIISTAVGSPSTSVDMMLIPAASVDHIEILRDGAAAQYGSDAVAGVINIVLKKSTNRLSGSFTGGGYMNSGGDGGKYTEDGKPDGYNYQLSANYGFSLGKKGFINISGELTQRRPTLRPFVNDWNVYDGTYLTNQRTDKFGNPVITNPELVAAQAAGNATLAASLATPEGLMGARGLKQSDFAVWAGSPAITMGTVYFNSEIPIDETTTFYAFGGMGYKFLQSYSCYYRRPEQTDRFNYLLYPNGFRPEMTTNTSDISTTMGIRGKIGIFNVDFSNTYGRNKSRIGMVNTMNASLGSNSPINMNLGTHAFSQNTTNLDFSKYFPEVMRGLNIAFGAEMRVENYKIIKGQDEGFTYGDAGVVTVGEDGFLVGPDGKPLEDGSSTPIVDANGNPLEVTKGEKVTVKSLSANCQCFAGFGPKNERDEFRTDVSAYIDAELNLTEDFMIAGAARVENYSDFGDVVIGKFAARYSILDNLSLRGSLSTGFRAPSLQELNYTTTATVFVTDQNGVPQPVDYTTYPSNSTAARVLGIKKLTEERSKSYGLGFAYQVSHKLEFSVDAYQIDVDDRIFLTGAFNAAEVGNNYDQVIGSQGEAQFFVNGGDIRSKGIELVGNYTTAVNKSVLTFNASAIFSRNQVIHKKTLDLNAANISEEALVNKYLNRQVIGQFETGTPRTKFIGFVQYKLGKFSTLFRGTYYGKVTELSTSTNANGEFWDQTFSGQTVFDLSVSYDITKNLKFSVGGNNIFDKYPELLREENRGFYLYSNNQQGSNGAYYYGRVLFSF
ncbi:TonB-dependent receptor [Chryseolinea lacunae]|uniref:TonB-dependent receptor n=1 Tax=Chryseolinea lacunae TaxID=2801331 RepID=A0ABS1KV60_9BACT|nr:TonB-dependent receptor [Chryseolinea lacunae]MBL0743198.1 TonB-dependent receptor [Chryseolinea lacunae]